MYQSNYFVRSRLHTRYKRKEDTVFHPLPGDTLFPTTVQVNHDTFIMDTPTELIVPLQAQGDNTTFTPWLKIAPYQTGSESKLANALKNGLAIAVSDGSYSELRGISTASWIITSSDKKTAVLRHVFPLVLLRYNLHTELKF